MNALINPLTQYRRKLVWLAVLLAGDLLLFAGTDAQKVNAFMLIIGFGLLVVTVYWLFYSLLMVLKLYGPVVEQKRRLAGSTTGLVACVVALQSVGELNTKDVLLLLPLVTVGYIYASYNLSGHHSE